jgi:hypothetical protein
LVDDHKMSMATAGVQWHTPCMLSRGRGRLSMMQDILE